MKTATAGFEFVDNDKIKHSYFFDGKKMTGVTAVLGPIGDKSGLIQWAANLAAAAAFVAAPKIKNIELLIKQIEGYKKITTAAAKEIDVLFPEFHDARVAHTKKRDKAAGKGTDVHWICENLIKTAIAETNGYFANSKMDFKNQLKQVQNFINWAIKNKIKFLGSECKVYSLEWFVGGTYDFKFEIDGKVYIGDIKTGGVFNRLPFAQCAAYEKMEKEMKPDAVIDGRCIVNIKKDGSFNEKNDVMWSYDVETDLELFVCALKIYRILNNY